MLFFVFCTLFPLFLAPSSRKRHPFSYARQSRLALTVNPIAAVFITASCFAASLVVASFVATPFVATSYITESFFSQSSFGQEPPAPLSPDPARFGNARPNTENYPIDAVMDRDQNVWVVDLNGRAVWKITSDKKEVFIQGSKNYREPLNRPRCLALKPTESGDNADRVSSLFVGDTSTREIYTFKEDLSPIALTKGQVGIPMDLAFQKDGTLLIADLERHAIWKMSPTGETNIFLPNANPRGLFVDDQDRIWVVSQNAEQLVRYDSKGVPTVLVASRIFEFPHQIVVDSKGTAWISDGYKKCIWKFNEGSQPEPAITSDLLQNPVGMLLVEDRPAVVDPHANAIFRVNADYKIEEWISLRK